MLEADLQQEPCAEGQPRAGTRVPGETGLGTKRCLGRMLHAGLRPPCVWRSPFGGSFGKMKMHWGAAGPWPVDRAGSSPQAGGLAVRHTQPLSQTIPESQAPSEARLLFLWPRSTETTSPAQEPSGKRNKSLSLAWMS